MAINPTIPADSDLANTLGSVVRNFKQEVVDEVDRIDGETSTLDTNLGLLDGRVGDAEDEIVLLAATRANVDRMMTNLAFGNMLILSDTSLRGTKNNTTYEKYAEFTVHVSGSLGISFTLKSTSGTVSNGRIYRNGSAVGTQRSEDTGAFTVFTENIAGWSVGDKLQIYGKIANSSFTYEVKDITAGVTAIPMITRDS